MNWFMVHTRIPLNLLEEAYNYLWGFINGLKLEKTDNEFVLKGFIYEKNKPDKLAKKLHAFLNFNAKTLNLKIQTPKISRVDHYEDDDFIIIPYPSIHTPPFGTKILIQRGRAFGIGSHPCTFYCLYGLKELYKICPDKIINGKILDAGCGTGILSIGAAKLGAQNIIGIDINPEAIAEAENNKKINNFNKEITIMKKSVTELSDEYDIILANLYGNLHIEISSSLCKKVKPGGYIILGGMNLLQSKDILATYQQNGFSLIKTYQDEEWCTSVGNVNF
jgi:ribosomal protein L11 methylase PrmA